MHLWTDLIIILVLLIMKSIVGFWEEYQARNTMMYLKLSVADHFGCIPSLRAMQNLKQFLKQYCIVWRYRMLKKILVAFDSSEHARKAVKIAGFLANRLRADIWVVVAFDPITA
jgi:hypothetical protein